MWTRWVWRLAAVQAAFLLAPATPAQARPSPGPEQVYRFEIPRKPLSEALLDLALQAEVSLGGDLGACGGLSRGLSGRFTLTEALMRLTEKSGCTARPLGARTILVSRRPVAASRPAPRTPPAEDAPVIVGELVVTSGRRVDLPGRSPSAITAIRGADLETTRAVDLQALSGQIAGMTVTNLGPGRDKILLRGMSDGAFTGQTQSTVGLYVDHVPVTYNAPDPDLKLVDVEQVEVLRGPQGSLYGSGSIGGIVRIVTRRPDLDVWSGDIIADGSSTASGGASNDLVATGNVPLSPGHLAVRGSAYREEVGGYIDDVGLGLSRVNTFSRDGARLALRASVNSSWALTAGLIHQSINTADTQYGDARLGDLKRSNAVREPHDNDFDERYLTLEGAGAWGEVVASSALLSHHFTTTYDASTALPTFNQPAGVAAFDEGQDIDLLVNEVVFTSAAQSRLGWLVGGFLSSGVSVRDTDLARPQTNGSPLYQEHRKDKLSEAALYGEIRYDLADDLTVVAGARWFRYDYEVDSVVAEGAAQRTAARRGHTSGLSPKLALRYQPDPRLLAYLQVSQGYRAGGFNTGGPIGQVFDGGPGRPDLEFGPDEFWNYEFGAKLALFDQRLRLRTAAFYADWRDIQSDQYLPAGIGYTVNVGDGVNRGLEVEADWRPTPAWDVQAAGILNDPQITKPNPNFKSLADAGLPSVSAVSASLALGYHRPLPAGLTLRLGLQANYVGASHLTFDAQSRYQMGDHGSLHLQAGVERDSWRAVLYVENPLNSDANTFAFGTPFRPAQEIVVTPPRPRTVGVRISASY